MGNPADPDDPDYEDGASCSQCSAVIFNDNTPKYVQAKFEGGIPCPAVPPITIPDSIILRQGVATPCDYTVSFRVVGILWVCTYWCYSANPAQRSNLELTREGAIVFLSTVTTICETNFQNQNDCTPPQIYKEGTGAITWGPEIDETAYDAQNPL